MNKAILTSLLVLLTVALSPLGHAAMKKSTGDGNPASHALCPGGGSTGAATVMANYEDCTVTYDARKGESQGSGTNTITFRSSSGTWTVSYRFGDGNYLMLGSGNLEGKAINVRFDGGEPASLKSSYGSGYCRVTSASRG